MKKIILSVASLAMSLSALAGGYLTNTNQNVPFLRQPARNATISVGGAYFNPAGIGFLPQGWQASFGAQNVHQTRTIESTYAPFAYNSAAKGEQTRTFKGKSYVPVLPSLDLSYVSGSGFFGSFHFGVVSGGGKATFDDGLGSFESQIAIIPAVLSSIPGAGPFGYGADISMVGEQYNFSGQIGLGYRAGEHWSFSAGVRVNYITNHYDAAIRNITLSFAGTSGPAATVLGSVLPTMLSAMGVTLTPDAAAGINASLGGLFADRVLDCDQNDWAFNPIFSVDYRSGRLNLAARYEMNTRVRLTNKTASDAGLAQYADGKKGIASDIPAMLSLGAEYSVLEGLRFSLGGNYYFDRQSKVYNPATGRNDKTDLIWRNTFEVLAGIEWDAAKKLTLSCGGQVTSFGWGEDKAFLSDQSFNPSSFSLGAGAAYKATDRLTIDLAVFNTFYSHVTKQMADYDGVGASTAASLSGLASAVPALGSLLGADKLAVSGSDRFHRTSLVLGLGVSYRF